MGHAILSPSSASRWMACTPSARLEQGFGNTTSTYAEEGTLAHFVAEGILRLHYEMITQAQFDEVLATAKLSVYYTEDLYQYAQGFADYVIEHCAEGYKMFIEHKLDMTNYVPEGFGTGDALGIKDKVMKFFDLKFGKGVRVDATENKQLMLYALGAYNDFGHIFEVETIEMHIYQPRIDNNSVFIISVKDLLDWAETELKEKAKLAFAGKGEFVPGSHCGFCKAKGQCRALAEYNLSLAELDFAEADLLTDDEIADILSRKKLFDDWISAVEAYAFGAALDGKVFPGWKLVEGRSNRVYSDQEKVIAELKKKKHVNIFTDPKLVGITELQKRIGKKDFETIVEPLLIKPEGRPTLVPESDKRAPITSAKDEFDKADAEDLI